MPYRVLIVEDNSVFANNIESIFREDLNYECVLVDTARAAQKQLFDSQHEQRFDLIITDMSLKDDTDKGFGGLDVLQTLSQIHKTELCVILSGSQDFSTRELKRIYEEYKDLVSNIIDKGSNVYNEIVGNVHPKVKRNSYHLFLSYRRQDSGSYIGRIHDSLIKEFKFNPRRVFRDLESIEVGTDFRDALRQGVRESDIVLVLIGPQWATLAGANGTPRLLDPTDYVRFEVEEAIRQRKHIIPLLLGDTQMPSADQVPVDMIPLVSKNAIRIRQDLDFGGDMKRLVEVIEKAISRG